MKNRETNFIQVEFKFKINLLKGQFMSLVQNDLVNILKFWNKTLFLHVYTNLLEIGSCGLARGETLKVCFLKDRLKRNSAAVFFKIYFKDHVYVSALSILLVLYHYSKRRRWGEPYRHITVFTFFPSSFKRTFLENVLWLEVVAFSFSQRKKAHHPGLFTALVSFI